MHSSQQEGSLGLSDRNEDLLVCGSGICGFLRLFEPPSSRPILPQSINIFGKQGMDWAISSNVLFSLTSLFLTSISLSSILINQLLSFPLSAPFSITSLSIITVACNSSFCLLIFASSDLRFTISLALLASPCKIRALMLQIYLSVVVGSAGGSSYLLLPIAQRFSSSSALMSQT